MIKAILFDIDGVIVLREGYFSERFSREYDIPLDEITPFFKKEFKKAVLGEVDLKEVLPKYLKKWHWEGDTTDFLDYWFSTETKVDEEIIALVSQLREYGIDCHLASTQEKYRANFLLDDMKLSYDFDEVFFSSDLGVDKSEPEFFKKVLASLSLEPSEVMFIDDDPKNIEAATKIGINAYLYEGVDSFKKQVQPLMAN